MPLQNQFTEVVCFELSYLIY